MKNPQNIPEEAISSVLVLMVISTLAVILGRRWPFVLVGWLWFAGTLFPVIGIVQAGRQSMADRYSYVPSIGVAIIGIWGCWAVARRWRISNSGVGLLAILTTAACVHLTRKQISTWQDTRTLWTHAAAVTEKNFMAYGLLGMEELYIRSNYDAAINNLEKAVKIEPMDWKLVTGLGVALKAKGRTEESIRVLQRVTSMDPGNALAHKEIASELAAKGRRSEAVSHLAAALRLYPSDPELAKELRDLTNAPTGASTALPSANLGK